MDRLSWPTIYEALSKRAEDLGAAKAQSEMANDGRESLWDVRLYELQLVYRELFGDIKHPFKRRFKAAYNKEKAEILLRQKPRRLPSTNPAVILRHERMLRAKERGRHLVDEWESMLAECGGLCACCRFEKATDRDHIIPVSMGGSDHISNLQPLCKWCNSAKGNSIGPDYIAAIRAKTAIEQIQLLTERQ